MSRLVLSLQIVLSLLCLWSAQAAADYRGPGSAPRPTNVAAILADPQDDQEVVLRGRIVRQTAREEYVFRDGTGEIGIEIDDDDFPDQAVDDTTEVEIWGEVDKDFRRAPMIEVERMHIVVK